MRQISAEQVAVITQQGLLSSAKKLVICLHVPTKTINDTKTLEIS